MEALLTYKDVAEILKVSERKAWELVDKGKILSCKIGRQVRVTSEALQDFIHRSQKA